MQYARDWGWRDNQTSWFDDFGLTGAAAEHRPQYMEMRRLLRAGDVGLVGASDISRLWRDAVEGLAFVQDCAIHGVLIAVDGTIIDPREPSAWLLTGFKTLLSQYQALIIKETVERGIIGKLEAGKAVTHPPVGYEKGADEQWLITSDLRVQAAISAIFRVFLQARSLRATVRRLLELHVEVPVRGCGGATEFRKPSIARVHRILGNPNYTPDYYYGRRKVDPTKPRTARGQRRMRRAKAEEVSLTKDHHDGYITREQWVEIQAIFRINAWSKDHASIGHGDAIAQGLVRCSLHRGWVLRVHYKRGPKNGSRSHAYYCEGDYKIGGSTCRAVPGARLDDAVLREALERLSPPSICAVQDALKRFAADSRAEQRHGELEAACLRQRVSFLKRKYEALDPDSVEVSKHVEHELECALRNLAAIDGRDDDKRGQMAREYASILEDAVQLAPDVPQIVNAATTTNRDRKELVRILVRAVLIDEWGREKLHVRICWNDDAPDTSIDVCLRAGIERIILEQWERGKKSDEIARTLNDAGIKTNRGNLWNRQSVRDFVRERSSHRRAARRRQREKDRRRMSGGSSA
jgi:DNA invertase Pin-like site-specific DNA recombinase